MNAWDDIVAIDRRIAAITSRAVNLVATGDENREFPDAVYTEAKRYLKALVGFGRGQPPVPSSPGYRDEYGALFGAVLADPAPMVTAEQDRMLRHPDVYQLVCTQVYDRLCATYDRRHGWRWAKR